QTVVECVPDENVGEAQASRGSWNVGDDTLGNRLVEQLAQGLAFQPADVCQIIEIELATEYRSQRQDAVAFLGEAAQTPADDLLDGLRNGKLRAWLVQASL